MEGLNLVHIMLAVVFVINFVLGTLIYFQDRKNNINIFYGTAVLSTALWVISMFLFQSLEDPALINIVARSLYIAGSLIGTSMVCFSYVFPSGDKSKIKKRRLIIYIPTLIVLGIVLMPSFIQGYEVIDGVKTLSFNTILYVIYSLHLVGYFVWAFVNMSKNYIKSKGEVRLKFHFIY